MFDLRLESSQTLDEIENNFKDTDFFSGIMDGLEEALAHKNGEASAETLERERPLPAVDTVGDIAYAGEQKPAVKVCGVRPMEGHKLWLRFNTGEAKIFDFTPLLDDEAFVPLRDESVFAGVYIDYGVTVWADGDIDISPAYLYENAVAVQETA